MKEKTKKILLLGGLGAAAAVTSYAVIHASNQQFPVFGAQPQYPGSAGPIPDPTEPSTMTMKENQLFSVSGGCYYYFGAQSNGSGTLPCNGVRTHVNIVNENPPAGLVSFWCAVESSAKIWAQIGYYFNSGTAPIQLWQIWNMATSPPTELATYSGFVSIPYGTHEFAIYWSGTGTIWNLEMDGKTIKSYDFKSTSSTNAGGYPFYVLCEQGGIDVPWPLQNQVIFPTAMEVLRNGSWIPVPTANVYTGKQSFGTTCTGTESGNNGVAGNAQNPSIPMDQMILGAGISNLSGTLWNSTVVSPKLTTLSISATTSTSLPSSGGSVSFSGKALDQNGVGFPSATCSIMVNGTSIGSVISDSSGNLTFSVQASPNGSSTPSTDITDIVSGSIMSNQVTITVAGLVSTSPNLLANPGFENSTLSPWTGSAASATVSIDTTVPHSGAQCMKETESNNTETLFVKQTVPATVLLPNTTYTMAGWIQTVGIVPNPAGAEIEVYDPNTGRTYASKDVVGTTPWTNYSYSFMTGSRVAHGLVVECNLRKCTGTAYFDDLDLYQS